MSDESPTAPATTNPQRGNPPISVVLALGSLVPAVAIRMGHVTVATHTLSAAIFGMAIVGSAFLLSWAAEVAELDISRGLAIAVLALIAVLPEYAVDLVFARKGGHDYAKYGTACKAIGSKADASCSLALANMTGGNRMLIGIGWALVVFVAYFAWRKRGEHRTSVTLPRSHSIEVAYLTIAALVGLTLPLGHVVSLVDSAILVVIFIAYTIRIARADAEAPELVGPAAWIGTFYVAKRRTTVIAMFLLSGFVILLCAQPFADSLVATGRSLGIQEFFLVQWVAPLATEAPELLIAGLFAWRLRANNGLSTLVSSKVNQWTLLVGTLPIAFALAAGKAHGLPIDGVQREELLLTAAQTLFALSVLINLEIGMREAIGLVTLFFIQFFLGAIPNLINAFGGTFNPDHFESIVRLSISAIYIVTAGTLIIRQRRQFVRVLSDGLFTPLSELTD